MGTEPKKRECDSAVLKAKLEKLAAGRKGTIDADIRPSIHMAGSAGQPAMPEPVRVPLGITEVDRALDPADHAGITVNALHEVRVETGLAAAAGAGFALSLGLVMARGKQQGKTRQSAMKDETAQTVAEPASLPPVFWISDGYTRREYGAFYGPGFQIFDLCAGDLIRIHANGSEETLWAAGEIAATPNAAAFCLIEINGHPAEIDLTATRRLMLRARTSGTPVILLRQSGNEEASAAHTRWRVRPATSSPVLVAREADVPGPLQRQFIGPPAFAVTLEKCRGGHANPSTQWTLEWSRDEQRFTEIASPSIASKAGSAGHNSGREQSRAGASLSLHPSAKTRHRQDPAAKTG